VAGTIVRIIVEKRISKRILEINFKIIMIKSLENKLLDNNNNLVKTTESGLGFYYFLSYFYFPFDLFFIFSIFRTLELGLEVINHISHI